MAAGLSGNRFLSVSARTWPTRGWFSGFKQLFGGMEPPSPKKACIDADDAITAAAAAPEDDVLKVSRDAADIVCVCILFFTCRRV